MQAVEASIAVLVLGLQGAPAPVSVSACGAAVRVWVVEAEAVAGAGGVVSALGALPAAAEALLDRAVAAPIDVLEVASVDVRSPGARGRTASVDARETGTEGSGPVAQSVWLRRMELRMGLRAQARNLARVGAPALGARHKAPQAVRHLPN